MRRLDLLLAMGWGEVRQDEIPAEVLAAVAEHLASCEKSLDSRGALPR